MKRILLAVALLISSLAAGQTNVNVDQGLTPYASYHGGDLDSVSLISGNLNLHIPLLSYPQRGRLNLAYFIKYNAKGWKVHSWYVGTQLYQQWQWQNQSNGVTVGWSNDYRFMPYSYSDQGAFIAGSIQTPDGASHATLSLVSSGNEVAIDSSGMQSDTTMSGMVGSDGTYYQTGGTRITRDANGNEILAGTDNTMTDSIGRSIPGGTYVPTQNRFYPGTSTSDLSSCPSGTSSASVWNVPAFNGTTAAYKFCFASFSINSNFGVSYITEAGGTLNAMNAVILPNGTSWQFSYSANGDLSQITLPTGGTISYTWSVGSSNGGDTPVSRWVTQRTVNANDGTGSHTWTYNYSLSPFGTRVTDRAEIAAENRDPDFDTTLNAVKGFLTE